MDKKTRLNGWWRLYIVISIFWTICMILNSGNIFYSKGKLTAIVSLEDPNSSDRKQIKIIFSKTTSGSELDYLINEKYGPQLLEDYDQLPAVFDKPYLEYIARKQKKLISTLKNIFIPITVLLVLGLSFVWVRRGFHKNKTA